MKHFVQKYFDTIKKFLPSEQKASAVGLDIGTGECKLVELTKTGNEYELANWSVEPIQNGDIKAAVQQSLSHLTSPCKSLYTSVFGKGTLIRYIDKTNRELTSFLESIRFSEFTRKFNMEGMGSSFEQLNIALNEVINDFQRVRSEKEEHFYYLQTILQNIDVSLIAYQTDGTIDLINKSAKKLFQVTGLTNIRKLEKLSKELVDVLFAIKPGESKLVKVYDEDDFLQLAIYATTIKVREKLITLVTN